MKSRKQVWIAALCLCSAIAIAAAFTVRTTHVQVAKHVVSKSPTSLAQPAVYLASPSLRGVMMDDDGPVRVGSRTIFPPVEEFTLTPPDPAAGIDKTILTVSFPEAQAAKLPSNIPMTLAKQNVILRRSPTAANVFVTSLDFNWQKFAEEQAQRKLGASQGRMIPIFDGRRYLGRQLMQFIEPAQIQGALQSHQTIHFSPQTLSGGMMNVWPDHQLIMVDPHVVEDTGGPGAQGRTFDHCLAQLADKNPGNPNGAWTFNTLMMGIAGLSPSDNPQPAENMLLGMLNSWNSLQSINNLFVLARTNMGVLNTGNPSQTPPASGLLGNWPVDPNNSCNGPNNACPSLVNAPVRLEAIVNRIDLGANGVPPFSPAGELRFVFTVTTELLSEGAGLCNNPGGPAGPIFNIILEYRVGENLFPTALSWAQVWNNLQHVSNGVFDETYLSSLEQTITDPITAPGACLDNQQNPISCISQVRTNEIMLTPSSGPNHGTWEEREFHFSNTGGIPVLSEGTVAQAPDGRYNNSGVPLCTNVNGNLPPLCQSLAGMLGGYITSVDTTMQFENTHGAAPPVPDNLSNGLSFLGGSAINPGGTFWNDSGIENNLNDASRIDFSSNTCNGCHGRETMTDFQQVVFRQIGSASTLAGFLQGNPGDQNCLLSVENLGENGDPCQESVQDPAPGNSGVSTNFGDIARRVMYIQSVCEDQQCNGMMDLLLPFTNKPIGVH